MKNLKPLSLAAAVATASAGYAGVANAQAVLSGAGLGDAAIVPYYTVQGDLVSGIHVINTSDLTQVVKLRWRRGSDSMDALDFNVVLSPKDEWTGFITNDETGIYVGTDDNSCTAPISVWQNGRADMPLGFHVGAEEGYVEVIGMGSAAEGSPIAIAADHRKNGGQPFDCAAVESNFYRVATTAPVAFDPSAATGDNGVLASNLSAQNCTDAIGLATGAVPFGQTCASAGIRYLQNDYMNTGDVLKVSYFVRNAAEGLEMGNDAVHLENFSAVAMMSNQEALQIGQVDLWSYLFPDLDGGSPGDTGRGLYDGVRAALGAGSVINDWSVASARGVSTDWVVTMPGQYLMVSPIKYQFSALGQGVCLTDTALPAYNAANPLTPETWCDARDLPVTISPIEIWDRDELTFTSPEGGLVISPAATSAPSTDQLPYEVNVIEWTDGTNAPVLDSQYAKQYDVSALGAENGWAELGVVPAPTHTQGIFNWAATLPLWAQNPAATPVFDAPSPAAVPIVGFVAWERVFESNPTANYGRIVEHSYTSN